MIVADFKTTNDAQLNRATSEAELECKLTPSFMSIFNDMYSKLLIHPSINHALFSYLFSQSSKGFTPQQFQIYRDTFFARTWTTLSSVLRVVMAAANEGDHFTVAKAGSNVYDETGQGDPKLSHCRLLEESHNIHGKNVFGLSPIAVSEAISSSFCIPEVRQFRNIQLKLYTDKKYQRILGASMAQELAADSMLEGFYNSFFLPYRLSYDANQFRELSKYFIGHIGEPNDVQRGAEARHGIDSKNSALNSCKSVSDINEVFAGANDFLSAQGALWDSLLSKIRLS